MARTVCCRTIQGKCLLFFNNSDCLVKDGSSLTMIIRDQKTSSHVGMYKCKPPKKVNDLLSFWTTKARDHCAETLSINHDNVFFHVVTGREFSQQSFSKYAQRAFRAITGKDINLQIIRRIVTDGVLNNHHPGKKHLHRVPQQPHFPDGMAISCKVHVDWGIFPAEDILS